MEDKVRELLEEGKKYIKEENYELAENELKKALEINEKNLETYLKLGQIYRKQKKI